MQTRALGRRTATRRLAFHLSCQDILPFAVFIVLLCDGRLLGSPAPIQTLGCESSVDGPSDLALPQRTSYSHGPRLVVDKTVYDLGRIKVGGQAEAVFQVGEQYWAMAGAERAKSLGGLTKGQTIIIIGKMPALPEEAKAAYSNAMSVWKRIIDDLPMSNVTAQAVFYVGECCRSLEQYQEAMAAYQKVVDQWPDYEHAWMAEDRIVKGYQDMARLGSISVYESEAAMAAAYGRMLKLFPSCPVASRASEWLASRQGKSEAQLHQEAAQREQLMKLVRSRANEGGAK